MPSQLKLITCMAAAVALLTALAPAGSSDDDALPTYRIANLARAGAPPDAMFFYYTRKLSEAIARLSGAGRSESPNEDMGKCCKNAPKHGPCEEVSATLEPLSDKKQVHVSVVEYGTPGHSGDLATWTCQLSMPDLLCYQSLVNKMATAVEEHDKDCHRGRKCQTKGGHFVPAPN
jgi:hypothetical protein